MWIFFSITAKKMKNKYQPDDFAVKELQFEMFCKVRNWSKWRFDENRKNKGQCIGYALTDEGQEEIFLISEKGNYYRYVKSRVWEPYEYVLNKGE